MNARRFFVGWKFPTSCFVGIVLIFLLLAVCSLCVDVEEVVIHYVSIHDPALHDVLDGKCVVHISDLHIHQIGRREKNVLAILDRLAPDLMFLTGDYVKWKGDYEAAITFLSRLKAKIGVWAVLGDYDYSRSRQSCLFCHEPGNGKPTQRHHVTFLRNSWERVDLEGGPLWVGGVDFRDTEPSLEITPFLAVKRDGPSIVLSHNPLHFDRMERSNQSLLVLAGDTHGGQIPLPSLVWTIFGYEKNAKYNRGLFEAGLRKMHVSSGVGTSHLPIRLFRPPEIAVLRF